MAQPLRRRRGTALQADRVAGRGLAGAPPLGRREVPVPGAGARRGVLAVPVAPGIVVSALAVARQVTLGVLTRVGGVPAPPVAPAPARPAVGVARPRPQAGSGSALAPPVDVAPPAAREGRVRSVAVAPAGLVLFHEERVELGRPDTPVGPQVAPVAPPPESVGVGELVVEGLTVPPSVVAVGRVQAGQPPPPNEGTLVVGPALPPVPRPLSASVAILAALADERPEETLPLETVARAKTPVGPVMARPGARLTVHTQISIAVSVSVGARRPVVMPLTRPPTIFTVTGIQIRPAEVENTLSFERRVVGTPLPVALPTTVPRLTSLLGHVSPLVIVKKITFTVPLVNEVLQKTGPCSLVYVKVSVPTPTPSRRV